MVQSVVLGEDFEVAPASRLMASKGRSIPIESETTVQNIERFQSGLISLKLISEGSSMIVSRKCLHDQ